MAIAGLQRISSAPSSLVHPQKFPIESSNSSPSIPTVKSARSSVSPVNSSQNPNLIDPASHLLEDVDVCSAECEVNIAGEWLEKLPPTTYDEQYVLKRNARHRIINMHSRLGCQVVLTQEMQGMVVAVPEAKPWDTPYV